MYTYVYFIFLYIKIFITLILIFLLIQHNFLPQNLPYHLTNDKSKSLDEVDENNVLIYIIFQRFKFFILKNHHLLNFDQQRLFTSCFLFL